MTTCALGLRRILASSHKIASLATTHQEHCCHCDEREATKESQLKSIEQKGLCPMRNALRELRHQRPSCSRDLAMQRMSLVSHDKKSGKWAYLMVRRIVMKGRFAIHVPHQRHIGRRVGQNAFGSR